MYGCTLKVRAAVQAKREKKAYHKLPEDKAVRKAWIAKIKREEFVVSRHSMVCSLHFTKESFQRSLDLANSIALMLKAELLPDAVRQYLCIAKSKSAHVVPARRECIQNEVSLIIL